MSNLQHKKQALRAKILKLRENLSQKDVHFQSQEIQKQAIKFLLTHTKLKRVGLYLSIQNEVETFEIHAFCLRKNIYPVYPRVLKAQKKLVFHEVKDLTSLKKGAYGILEPVEGHRAVLWNEIDVIFVPGIAFDRKGNRLGYGKGYYDRTLKEVSRAQMIGLGFDFQIVSGLPHGVEDIPMHKIISTEFVL